MAWEVWWALVLGFAISAIVQAWVPRARIESALAGDGPRPLVWATGLGAASSSCSYAAIAIGKSIFQKGASAVVDPRLPVRVDEPRVGARARPVGADRLAVRAGRVRRRPRDDRADGAPSSPLRLAAGSRSGPRGTRRRPTPATSTTRSASSSAAQADHERIGLVGRRPQLPRRLADAVEGDHPRLRVRRVRRPPRQRLLQRALPDRRPRAGGRRRERDCRPAHRRPQLRLLGRQRAAGGRALVGRHQLRRRDGVHLRRPDRAADHRDLPQVLRLAVRAPHHRAHARDDGGGRAPRRRGSSPRSGSSPTRARRATTSSAPSSSTTSSCSTLSGSSSSPRSSG